MTPVRISISVIVAGLLPAFTAFPAFAHQEVNAAPASALQETFWVPDAAPGWLQFAEGFFLRKAAERGHFQAPHLDYRFTFSYDVYLDFRYTGFRALRFLNEIILQPGKGFDQHEHRNEEIISYVLSGTLEHTDDLGNKNLLSRGIVQKTSTGPKVIHREYNHSNTEELHFIQILLSPEPSGIQPEVEYKNFPEDEMKGRLRVIASKDGRENSLRVNQDIVLYAAQLEQNQEILYAVPAKRYAWLQIAEGAASLNGYELQTSDGVAVMEGKKLRITSKERSHILLFDLS